MEKNTLNKKVSMIVASDLNGCIGKDNKLCWNIPEDLKRFKELTSGTTIIMGRKTFESLPKVLPNRTSVVITRDTEYKAPEGVFVSRSVDDAIELANSLPNEDIFIIGGAQIYNQTIGYVSHVYWTMVETEVDGGDAFVDKEQLLTGFYPASSMVNSGPLTYAFEEFKRMDNGITQQKNT